MPTSDPVEFDVRARDPVSFEMGPSAPAEWGASEYIPYVASEAPDYEGPYEATPSWSDQTFATSYRLMRDNFEVESIVQLEAPNDAGGLTLTI